MIQLVAALALTLASPFESADVTVREKDGELLCTVHAHQVRIDDLLRDIALKSSREVEGLEGLQDFAAVDADLVDRPLDMVVDWLAGAAGLRAQAKARTITVKPDLDGTASISELEDLADVMYVRALRRFPEAEMAAEAELRLGDIQAARMNDGAAQAHYEALVRIHPDSNLVGEALMRSATILSRLGSWKEATSRWSMLANRPAPNPYAVKARVELARSLAFSGDGRQALAMLGALETAAPAASPTERAERMYIRAAGLVAAGNGAEGLEMLDAAMKAGLDQASSLDAVALRADALDHANRPTEAALAWLSFARACTDVRRKDAFVRAATSASEAGDRLGVLFVERIAVGSGAEARIRPLAEAARAALGLTEQSDESIADRLERAELQCENASFAQAASTIVSVWRDRARLSEPDVVRAVLVRARCTDATDGIQPAIAQLAAALEEVKQAENRRRIYLLAGELYENRSQWELAAQAYGGRL